MAKMYYDHDAKWDVIEGKTVAIIGYGSQGHAHALNLKESGIRVIVGLYEGSKSWDKAAAEGLEVMTVANAVKNRLRSTNRKSNRTSNRAVHLHSHTASISTSNRSYRRQTLTYSWSHRKARVISFAAYSPKAAAYRA